MPSARDVPADPSRPMAANTSKSDRRLRLIASRPRSATRHAIPTSEEQLDKAVQSIRQLAEEMNKSARDELAHILESDGPGDLSSIMDIAERDPAVTLSIKSDTKPLPLAARSSEHHGRPLLEEKRQGRTANTPAPIRWRRWVGSLVFTVLIATAGALLFIAAPRLLSGAQGGREVRGALMPSSLSGTGRRSFPQWQNDRAISVAEAAKGQTLPSVGAPVHNATRPSNGEASGVAPNVEAPAVEPRHYEMSPKGSADEGYAPGSSQSIAPRQPDTQHSALDSKVARLPSPQADASSVTEKQLLQRAEALLQSRDISGARLILERAISFGSAKAAYHLAQTYDPAILDGWQVRGISGDMAKSRELHQLARTLGSRPIGANAASP